MKLSVLQENMSRGLSIVSRSIDPGRPMLPILTNVLLETTDRNSLRLTGTNLQTTVSVEIGAKIEVHGKTTVPVKLFRQFISSSSSTAIHMHLDNNERLSVDCGTHHAVFPGIPAEDFPPSRHAEEFEFEVKGERLKEAINHSIVAASKEIHRPVFTGVYFHIHEGTLTMATADGYRLAERILEGIDGDGEERQEVIPVVSMALVGQVAEDGLNVRIGFSDERKSVTFQLGEYVKITSRVLSGAYPAYKQIIPSSFSTVIDVNRNELLENAKRIAMFVKENNHSVILDVDPSSESSDGGDLKLLGNGIEHGNAEGFFTVQVTGDPLRVRFNIQFLIDVLNANKDEELVISANGPESPMLISLPDRQDYHYVIMPMNG